MKKKNIEINRSKLSELFSGGAPFVNCELKKDFNDSTVTHYLTEVVVKDLKGSITVDVKEPLPKDLEFMQLLDFENFKLVFKGKCTGKMNDNFLTEVEVTATADRAIPLRSSNVVNTQPSNQVKK